MTIPTRMLLVATLALVLTGCRREEAPHETPPPRPGPRISMADLHRTGGVPPGWHFTVPPGDVGAGARAFVDLGCDSCHHVAGVASSAADERRGPDLTGMGGHHPPEYFVESILTPDAVLVDGPGWIGPDGHSTMPAYPDLTLRQLADLVAYLKSLRAGGAAEMMAAVMARPPSDVPPPAPGSSTIYYVQVYDVLEGELGKLQDWFRTEGAAAFLAHDGIVGVDTWVDVSRDGPALTTVIGFRDDAAMKRFLDDPTTDELGRKFDEFIGPHSHRVYRQQPVYRAASLSAP
jgi:hypothetical protein